MNDFNYRIIPISIWIGLIILLVGQQQIQAQNKNPLNLWEVRKVLVFRRSVRTSADELNKRLIEDVKKRSVNFILSVEDEESLKKAGASELLIKAIRENLPEKLKDRILLYQKYLDNYDKTLDRKKVALKAAKECVGKYGSCVEDKELIDYFKLAISVLELEIH